MQLYNFERLIEKYSTECQLINTTEGDWIAGEWVEGDTATTPVYGAVVPITEKRINNSGGDYKQGDCEFITREPIELNSDTHLVYKGKQYKLEDSTDYSEYADFYIYIARRVSAFDRGTGKANDNA